MDRIIVTPGQIPLDTDVLNTNKNTMLALGRAFAAIFGTNNIANGLAVTAAASGLTVNVAAGSIYSLQNVDNTPYGSLPLDTTDTVVKQGINPSVATLPCPAPNTAGFSINYLIQATFQEVDGQQVLLPFYNANNPAQPYSGPGGNNAQINTVRQDQVGLIATAGVAAATGTQVTPALSAGYIPLAVVTVTYGQTTIPSGQVVTSQQNIIGTSLLQAIQSSSFTYGKDVGALNACVVNLTPAITALTDGFELTFNVANANTANCTLNVNGTGAFPIITAGLTALVSGELTAGARATVQWDNALSSWVLLNATGAGAQRGVTPPQNDNSTRLATTASVFSQLTGTVGSTRNLSCSVSAVSASATWTADQVVLGTALNGQQYLLPSYNQALNLATTGAGGMDTGSAPASGFVAIYAIYNPVSGAASILATNATAAAAPTIYGGAHMPSGYVASALISVIGTNASSLLLPFFQHDRDIRITTTSGFSTTGVEATPTSFSLSTVVPLNAKLCHGVILLNNTTAATTVGCSLSSSSTLIGQQVVEGYIGTSNQGVIGNFANLELQAAQTLFYTIADNGGGAPSLNVDVSGYTI